jgi:hypothetical protein
MRLAKKMKAQDSHEFYKFALIAKSFETLSWYAARSSERRNKVEFMQQIRNEKALALSLEGLRMNRNRSLVVTHKFQ